MTKLIKDIIAKLGLEEKPTMAENIAMIYSAIDTIIGDNEAKSQIIANRENKDKAD